MTGWQLWKNKKMNNILITGITSIHGWPIFSFFREKYRDNVYAVCPLKMSEYFEKDEKVFYCDIENYSGLEEIFNTVRPDAVLHAGGVCDLDMCEDSPGFAYDVNVIGARNIVSLSENSYLLYISSDLVFSGNNSFSATKGYTEFCKTDPVSVVGRTYVEAENEVQKHNFYGIVRVGLPIGPSISGTKGAVDFIAKRLGKKQRMTLFHDEIRSLITTSDLARGIFSFFDKRGQGLFHFGGQQEYSLYDIGEHLVNTHGYHKEYLIRSSRFDEKNGPPRIGRVTLDSSKFYEFTEFVPCTVWSGQAVEVCP